MIGNVIGNALTNFIISLGLDAIIFNIMYSILNLKQSYLKSVIIYTICLQVKLIIITGIASFQLFLIAFGLYFVMGLILVWILDKIAVSLSRVSFIVTGIILQNIIVWVLQLII